MKLGIMQPYFFPYIGYFHLMNAVDEFVVYDDIEYTKKGWINRNRILVNGADAYITLPLRKGSDFLDVRERFLADTWKIDRTKLLQRVSSAYRKAPHFVDTFALFERCVLLDEPNLYRFILNALQEIKSFLRITTPLIVSSEVGVDRSLRSQDRVIATCKARGATTYINPIGGLELYSRDVFLAEGIDLHFIKTNPITYEQFGSEFVPSLSIIDVMMFNSRDAIDQLIANAFTLS